MSWFQSENPQTGTGHPPAAGVSGKPEIRVRVVNRDGKLLESKSQLTEKPKKGK